MPRVLLLLSSLYMDIDILNHSPRFENTVFDALALSDLPEDHFETALSEHLRASQLREPALQIGCDRSRAIVRRYLEQTSTDGQTASLADVISEDEALRELIAGIF